MAAHAPNMGTGGRSARPEGRSRGPGGSARRTDARQLPHEQPQIEAADVHEQPFQDVGMSAQMHAAHAAGVIEMGVGPFQQFAPLPQQPFPARASDPPPIGIHRVPCRGLALPPTPAAVRLRDVAAYAADRNPTIVSLL